MKWISSLIGLFFVGCLVVFSIAFIVVLHFSKDLPDYKKLSVYQPQITSRLYTNTGSLLAEYAIEKRNFVPVETIPLKLKQAFIAVEDKNFYQHGGVDLLGIMRAFITNVKNIGKEKRPEGASTITQQVAKNFLLSSERSYSRKIKEALLARKIENAFTKEHILELYLNEIYLGIGSYGVASASLNYFDKSMKDLNLSEIAFLASLPKAPENYHPVRHKQQALERRNYVLERMQEEGYISKEEKEAAQKEDLHMIPREADLMREAGYYAEKVRQMITEKYGSDAMYQGGLAIRTSLDPTLQNIGVKVLQKGLLDYDKRHGWRGATKQIPLTDEGMAQLKAEKIPDYIPLTWQYAIVKQVSPSQATIILPDESLGLIRLDSLKWAKKPLPRQRISGEEVTSVTQVLKPSDLIFVEKTDQQQNDMPVYKLQQYPEVQGALVALNPHTGRVLAVIGGFSFYQNEFNRAIQANRQPGSSFKPFVYLTALDSGYTPSSIILDAPLVMEQPDGTMWKPKNYTMIFYGPTTLRVGLEKSRNLMTVRLAQAVGIKNVVEYGKKFGISDSLEPVLSTALGAGETTLLKLSTAYAMLVNGGKKITPNFIDRIQDRDGKTIYKHDDRICENCSGENASPDQIPSIEDNRPQIQDPVSAYQMVNILTGVVERGTARVANTVGKPLGAKTGTSNDNNDAWIIGFSPDLVVGIWIGFDTPSSLGPHDTGGVVAGPIFRDFMQEALKDKPALPFRIPEGVRLIRVDATTGKPAKYGSKNVIIEAFRKDSDLTFSEVKGKDITIKESKSEPEMGGLY